MDSKSHHGVFTVAQSAESLLSLRRKFRALRSEARDVANKLRGISARNRPIWSVESKSEAMIAPMQFTWMLLPHWCRKDRRVRVTGVVVEPDEGEGTSALRAETSM
jgi:hypothetical protein